ncbi:hypothetical protein [Campylobacter geochelonis]|uniref:DUF4136 domain-containing protein n=1 Tax=Campylobacter geochelonis TaxID=1780362 RepID=A0A128ERY8_9BACT|nr:hypothetical protein [Campylobacter geochelonis]QKF71813.1 hypothetical protein CGEO_1535 [Campylobacter geochelonis]CZE47475.1 Uncharacterised protein [Campylobacter geochelonis]CZE49335.1 Uncharacterised protein [Campylobacter geochelonis]CZE51433.1 Uncharacterised protein [Campylobacter geochelonis]
MVKNVGVLCILLFIFTGCSIVSQEAYVVPNSYKENTKTYYVEHLITDKNDLNKLIEKAIIKNGFSVVNNHKQADVIVTYIDRWFWDMGNYLILLKIQFRDSKNKFPMIVGENARTSFARKEPEFMVDELIKVMFEKQNRRF